MTDLSGKTGPQRLTSHAKVSLESTQKMPQTEVLEGPQGLEQLETEMQQISHAFALANEIRHSLETALRNL